MNNLVRRLHSTDCTHNKHKDLLLCLSPSFFFYFLNCAIFMEDWKGHEAIGLLTITTKETVDEGSMKLKCVCP